MSVPSQHGHRRIVPRARRLLIVQCSRAAAALALMLVLRVAQGYATSELRPFSGHYEGRRTVVLLPATAHASIELRRSSRFIVYTMRTIVNWAFVERRFQDCSVIEIQGDRLLPLEYLHRDESDARFDVHTRFDWTAGRAQTRLGPAPAPGTLALDGPTWDPLSFQVALIALAPQRRPGEREHHRVIERGVLKQHEVIFVGPVSPSGADGERPVFQIVSRKDQGQVGLWLRPDEAWRPARVAIDDVTIDLVATPAAPPASLPEGDVPSCEGGSVR
jgi:hypothetical protein